MTAAARDLLVSGLIKAMKISADLPMTAGTSVVGSADRRGTGFGAVYQMGSHTVIWCDPDVTDFFQPLAGPNATPEDRAYDWAADQSYEIVGRSTMKTVSALRPAPIPGGFRFHRFDWDRPTDLALLAELVEASSEDDLDEAEVAIEDLDPAAVGLLDAEGSVAAYAGMRPFELAPELGDIGVLGRATNRRAGLGSAVVSALIQQALPEGWQPLYRCDHVDNEASDRLSARLGFEPVVSLIAIRPVG